MELRHNRKWIFSVSAAPHSWGVAGYRDEGWGEGRLGFSSSKLCFVRW